MREVVQVLQAYLTRSLSFGECRDWLASVDWDDPALTKDDRESLGELELLLTEIGEGLRGEAEFWEAAARIVAANLAIVYGPTNISEVSVTTGATSPPLWVAFIVDPPASRSWNRSPQVVPSS